MAAGGSDDRTYDTVVSGSFDIGATGDNLFVWTPATPVEIIRIGLIGSAAEAYTHGSGAIVKADINSSDGDGTYTRGDGDGGTITVASTFDIGLVNYHEMTSRVRLRPGDQLIFQCTQAATAGAAFGFVEYRKLPFQSGSSEAANDLLVNATEV